MFRFVYQIIIIYINYALYFKRKCLNKILCFQIPDLVNEKHCLWFQHEDQNLFKSQATAFFFVVCHILQ